MIRIFVGCAANHEDIESQAVLEWSIRKQATDLEPLEFTWMKLSASPASPFYSNADKGEGWDTSRWATPFSGLRWAIPELCGFRGRAIYTDSDVMFLANIGELWGETFQPGKAIIGKGNGNSRICVSMFDCERAAAFIPPIGDMQRDPEAHRKLMSNVAHVVQPFATGDWNCLDGKGFARLDDPSLKALHYTNMATQPQLRHALPRLAGQGQRHWFDGQVQRHARPDIEHLFDQLLDEARRSGYPPRRYAEDPRFGPYRKRSLAS